MKNLIDMINEGATTVAAECPIKKLKKGETIEVVLLRNMSNNWDDNLKMFKTFGPMQDRTMMVIKDGKDLYGIRNYWGRFDANKRSYPEYNAAVDNSVRFLLKDAEVDEYYTISNYAYAATVGSRGKLDFEATYMTLDHRQFNDILGCVGTCRKLSPVTADLAGIFKEFLSNME